MAVHNGDIVRVDLLGKFNTVNDVINTFQFRVNSSGDVDEADVLLDLAALLAAVATVVANIANVLMVWHGIRAQNITQDTLLGEASFTEPIAGTGTSGPQAAGVAALMNFKTNKPKVILKKYFGVLDEAVVDAQGLLTSSAQVTLAQVADILADPDNGTFASYTYGVLSTKTSAFEVPSPGVVSPIPAYQRRRRQGRGS